MNNVQEVSQTDKFKLFNYLASDLRRMNTVLHGSVSTVMGLRLWVGLLSPRFVPVLLCRLAHFFYCSKLGPIAKILSLINFFLFGIEIAVRCPIGPGLFFPHTQGTVIGAWQIGANATIFQGVTLGAREVDFSYSQESRPIVGDDVTVGSGAKVLGGVHIGEGARIGANSVVLKSIEPYSVAVGIPAKVVRVLEGGHGSA
jgi:serine O-acetyltransferase